MHTEHTFMLCRVERDKEEVVMYYTPGLDNLLQDQVLLQSLKEKNIGLVTNHTGLNRDLELNIDLLYDNNKLNLVAIFAPEHGYWGNARDRARINNMQEEKTGLPLYSLYGDHIKPTSEMLSNIDIIIYDIQDIGLRYFTYISTLFYTLEACAENDVKVLVLDRLNPLGRKIEGNISDPGFRSFEGLYPLPMQHGMTVGELALWAKNEFLIDVELEIIKLKGWQGELFDQSHLTWIPPSPNIPTFTTALIYPITFLFEGTNISEGRGTAKPFEYIGAPWVNPYLLVDRLKSRDFKEITFRAIKFIPAFSKYQNKECGGIHIIFKSRKIENNIHTGLEILKVFLELYFDKILWIKHDNDHRYFFDLLMGTDRVRKRLKQGFKVADIISNWGKDEVRFNDIRKQYLLY
jgi:uncharacterized protein YbbC (DUF1343 family)